VSGGYRIPALQRAAGYHRVKAVAGGASEFPALAAETRVRVDPVRVAPALPDGVWVAVPPLIR